MVSLYIDFGSTFTKVAAIDIENEEILGTAKAPTTVETDILEGLNEAVLRLEKGIGKMEFNQKYASSSAAGGLKMVTVGLVPQLTAEASKRAALGAGAKVLKVYSYRLTTDDVFEINNLNPDIILICGGTDGGNRENIIYNSEAITSISKDIPLIFAGNREATHECTDILNRRFTDVRITQNVMPQLNILNVEPVRKTIREVFLEKIVEAKGFKKAQNGLSGILMPTPSAVLKAAGLLSEGFGEEKGIGELIVVDPGGATTDVHSIAKGLPKNDGAILRGLPEPYEKRTVEGDIGVRYSASSLIETYGADKIKAELAEANIEADVILRKIMEDHWFIPKSEEEFKVDNVLCRAAVSIASERHAGIIETVYTPFGGTFIQTGKDLTGIRFVIGTGGPIIHSNNPKMVLEGMIFDNFNPSRLKPCNPVFLVDKQYIMYALGLLGEKYPEKAVRMMKRYVGKLTP